MQFHYFSLVFGLLANTITATGVCDTGHYGLLKPLAGVPEAASFCSAKFPIVVTATKARRGAGTASPTTSKTSSKTSTPQVTSSITTSKSSTQSKTTSTKADAKQVLLSSLSACAYNVASTFCSCYFPPKTVQPSTTTPYNPCASPSPPAPHTLTCGSAVTCTDSTAMCTPASSADECSSICAAEPNGGCAQRAYDADTGACYVEEPCCYGQQKKHRLLRSRQLAEKRTWLKKRDQE